MTLRKRIGISSVIAAVASGAVLASAAIAASTAPGVRPAPTLSFVVHNEGLEFVTASGPTSVYPGHLQIGDRIFSRDALMQGTRAVGYGNELCTVTFDNHELCQETAVLPGKGQIQANWLWTDWPSGFGGVIAGGTGAFAHAGGTFASAPLAGGAFKFTATLN